MAASHAAMDRTIPRPEPETVVPRRHRLAPRAVCGPTSSAGPRDLARETARLSRCRSCPTSQATPDLAEGGIPCQDVECTLGRRGHPLSAQRDTAVIRGSG